MRRSRRLVTALTAGVVLAGVVAGTAQAAPAEADPVTLSVPEGEQQGGEVDGSEQPAPAWTPGTDTVTDADAADRAEFEKVTAEEARRRFAVEAAASALQQAAAERYPDSYAGLWLTLEPFGVTVSFTEAAEAKVADLSDEFAYPELLEPAPAAVPERALLALQQEVMADRSAVQQGRTSAAPPALQATGGRYDVALDLMANRVTVTLPAPDEETRGQVTRRYGPRVAVEQGTGGPGGCGIYDCRYAMMSGLELKLGTKSICSSAFTAYTSSYRYVLSAGHCYANSSEQRHYNAGSLYGYTDRYQYSGNVDAERVRRTSSTWRESSKYYVSGKNPVLVKSYTRLADIALNTYVGKTGRTTGTTRGYVTQKYISPGWIPNAGTAYFRTDYCGRPGDSGAGVWRSGSAYGIHHGHYFDTKCRRADGSIVTYKDGGQAVVNAIDHALAGMRVTLLKGVNLAPKASATRSCSLLTCTFYGSGSSDQDGRVTSWSWTFGDGSSASGSTVKHSYTLPGSYTVRLTVKDNNGASSSYSMSFFVP